MDYRTTIHLALAALVDADSVDSEVSVDLVDSASSHFSHSSRSGDVFVGFN
ncbi:hypothetical protein [Sporomusa aerivorans]|uniref:hypothetical protein n=1 Tax=Sporomusa aerivorans TaxID=204936 RepID=UPI00352A05BE